MFQTDRIFLSNINKKGMLKSEKTRHNIKVCKDLHCESEIVTMHVVFAP